MREKHRFGVFVPSKPRYLLLGSFPGKVEEGNDWFYATPRGQFWKIMEILYGKPFPTLMDKKQLFENLGIVVTDIIWSCVRVDNSNLDTKLKEIEHNTQNIQDILARYSIAAIYFSSATVERLFRRVFGTRYDYIPKIRLPSPSPRYSAISFSDKVKIYKKLFVVAHR